MGWYYTNGASRSDIITEIVEGSNPRHRTLRHCTRGNVLWTVGEVMVDSGTNHRYVGCYLLQKDEVGWGYKPMDWGMAPYYYSCPPSYLELATELSPPDSKWAIEWCHKVLEHWGHDKPQWLPALTQGAS